MLPFTKRPGREESGDVLTKESLDEPSRDAPFGRPRPFAKSISDEELTTLMPSKSVAVVSRPAPSVPPPPLSSRPASVPPPSVSRSVPPPRGKFMGDEDDGRTTVRGAPKIKKKGAALPTTPTAISPAAVIKSTLETAGRGKRNDLMAPPPRELLDELAEAHPADDNPHTVMLGGTTAPIAQPSTASMNANAFAPMGVPAPAPSRSVPPAPISRPQGQMHVPPAPNSRSMPPAPISASVPPPPHSQSMGHPYAPYGVPVPPASVSVPGVAMGVPPPSMPAHFMVPQAPHSDARMDPPAMVATARSSGRSTASWAMALLVLGVGVGLGGIALMRGNDGLRDTTAAFIDPARAAQPKAGAGAPADAPVEAPKPAAPAVATVTAPVVTPVVATPVVTTPAPAAPEPAPGVVATSAPVGQPTVAAPAAPQPVATHAAAAPAPAPQPVTHSAPRPAPVAAAPKPVPVAAAPKAEKPEPPPAPVAKKPAGKAGGGSKSEIDEETKKALEALQKSQLESSF